MRVRAVVDSRYYSGSYYSVTGVIPGSGSDEEVLELGHGFELGAQDNSTGQAGMLEAIAAVKLGATGAARSAATGATRRAVTEGAR